MAKERLRTGLIEGHQFMVEFDIANFFGEIDHDRLLIEVGRRVSDRVRSSRLQRTWQLLFRCVVDLSAVGTAAACCRQCVTFLVVLLCHVWCW